ncbi:MAG: 30S ribosomal protein S15 [Holosporales bacterium]|jgi:small subunit ribosomal protein S15|nr:30S ribosomal protein S15 [Holosporales bacterium]
MSTIDKQVLLEKFSEGKNDTGSAAIQIILLTDRINNLGDHLDLHRKDFHSRRGLLQMVSKRRSLLDFLKRKNTGRYQGLVSDLGLRR